VTTLAHVRRIALSLPETAEQDHHGLPSFRVAGRIFATVPDAAHVHVLLPDTYVEMAIGTSPHAGEELWWGKRLSGVRVTLASARSAHLAMLLTEAWRLKAPARLARAFPASPPASRQDVS
jgi:hypothetical protein